MGWKDAPIIEPAKGRNKWEDAPVIDVSPLSLQPAHKVGEYGQKEEGPGFFSRVGEAIGKRGQGIAEAFTAPIQSVRSGWSGDEKAGFFEAGPQRLLRAAGQGVALAGDITGEAIKSVVPEGAKKWAGERIKGVIHPEVQQAGLEALKQGGEAYAKFKEIFPDAAKDIEAVANIAAFSPAAKEYKNILKDVGKLSIKVLPKSVERWLYGSATKMPLGKKWVKTAGPEQISTRAKAIKEGFKSEVLPTEAGLNKITGLEKQALKEVDDVIARLTSEGKTVKRSELLAGLDNAYKTAEVSSRPDIAKSVLDNLKDTVMGYPENLPANLVQRIKREWYKESSWSGNMPIGVGARFTEKGRKGVSNAAMRALEELEPSLKGLNQTDAARIALKEGIERAVGRIGNRNISDLGSEIMSGTGAVIGGVPGAAAGFTLKKLIEMPEIKSKLAFAINRVRNAGPSSGLGKLLTTSRPPIPPMVPPSPPAIPTPFAANDRGLSKSPLTRIGSSISNMTPEGASELVNEALGPMTAKGSAEVFKRNMRNLTEKDAAESAKVFFYGYEPPPNSYMPKVRKGSAERSAEAFTKAMTGKSAMESMETFLEKFPPSALESTRPIDAARIKPAGLLDFKKLIDQSLLQKGSKSAKKSAGIFNTLPMRLANAVDDNPVKAMEHVNLVSRLAKTSKDQAKAIIDDTVRNPVTTAEMLANRGKTEKAVAELNKAIKNGNNLKMADGPITETHVNRILDKVPQIRKKIAQKPLNKALRKSGGKVIP